MTRPKLVLGTHNAKKLRELQQLLPVGVFDLHSLADMPHAITVAETGNTFRANAALKATEQAKHLGCWVLAEDSGLCVDALGGAPGVYSARYAGVDGDDAANNRKLLKELEGVPLERRTAHYECHACLSDPQGNVRLERSGVCCGRILSAALGEGGFGYDPMFEVIEYHCTFGQLDASVKRAISHRARAMRQVMRDLVSIVAQG
jgi:XTP/dITP diphosphohydrolase